MCISFGYVWVQIKQILKYRFQMELEVQQQEQAVVNPANKQAFIYKKNPTTANKAITRKLRQSQVPEAQNSSMANDQTADDIRNSQNEAETIATQGQQSGISPRGQALSQGNFNRLDSEVVATSDVNSRPMDNRRFHTSHRINKSATRGKVATYYEDNIDSETEVFIDPAFETKLGGPRPTADNLRPAARQLFPKTSDAKRPHRKSPEQQDAYFQAIDAVVNSNHDDKTKQRLILQIQQKHRQSAPEKHGKPRTQKHFKDGEEEQFEGRPKRNRHIQSQDDGPNFVDIRNGPVNSAQHPPSKNIGRKLRGAGQEDQTAHKQYLMPEMNEFMAEGQDKHNYLTQDETGGNSRLAQLGHNKRKGRKPKESGIESQDDSLVNNKNMKNFTPGRIRASRMGLSNMNEYDRKQNNYLNTPGQEDILAGTSDRNNKRARTRPQRGHQPHVDSIDDSMDSIGEAGDYDQMLPSVKMRPKKKKRSPSSNSQGRVSRIGGPHSQSIMSTSQMHKQDPKLRPTLDEGLHFVPASIQVPTKQTLFYDDKHHSGLTEQQKQSWKQHNGQVYLDTFHAGKSKVPINRHRIPDVMAGDFQRRKISPVDTKKYMWDLDGRKHPMSKKIPKRVITSNASLHKVDLPRIKPGHTGIFSPNGTGIYSQPNGISHLPPAQQFGSHPSAGKFVNPNDPKVRRKQPVPRILNDESNPGLPLVDIDIRPNKLPTAKIYEPPIVDDERGKSPNSDDVGLDDYDCPVCLERVPGPSTAKHSRACRTQSCRFCKKEQPIDTLEKHEANCNTPVTCNFCKVEFPRPDFDTHEGNGCPEAVNCKLCSKPFPRPDLPVHENNCGKPPQTCQFCKNDFPLPDFDNHKADGCPEAVLCRYCQNKFPSVDLKAHEGECGQFDHCKWCLNEFRLARLPLHEIECPELAVCQFCQTNQPRKEMPDHLECCPEAAACRFCNNLLPRDIIDEHEGGQCPEAQECNQCKDFIPKDLHEDHVRKYCPKAIPGVPADAEPIDPTPYNDLVEKNAKKLQKKNSKVVVEDDYIEPNDFRDPANRKQKRQDSQEGLKNKPKQDPYSSNGSRANKFNGSKKGSVSGPEGSKSKTNDDPSVSIGLGSNEFIKNPASNSKSGGSKQGSMSPVAKKSIGGTTSFDKRNNGSTAGLPPKSPSHSQTRPVQSPFSNKKSILKSQTKGSSPYSKSPRAAGSDNVGNGTKNSGRSSKRGGRSSKRGSLDRGSHDNKQKQGPSDDALLSRGSIEGGDKSGENALRPRIQDSISNAFKSEEGHQNYPEGQLLINSQESQGNKPKTEFNGNRDESLENGSIPHEGQYDVNSQDQQSDGPLVGEYQDKLNNFDHVGAQKKKSAHNVIGEQAKLQKVKSQNNTASQVRFASYKKESHMAAYENYESKKLTTSQVLNTNHSEYQKHEAKETNERRLHTHQSMETQIKQTTFQDQRLNVEQQSSVQHTANTRSAYHKNTKIEKQSSAHETSYEFKQARSENKTSIKKTTLKRRNTNEVRSRESGASRSRITQKTYFPGDARRSSMGSKGSKSPEARRVMETLTHHRVKIDEKTKLLINGSEVLSHKGIKGSIHKVGVGFGTGRHTSGRRLDLLKEVPAKASSKSPESVRKHTPPQHKRVSSQEPMVRSSQPMSPKSPQHRQEPVRMDAFTQQEVEVQSEGCDPILKSMRSARISAHVSQHEINLSAKTLPVMPDKESIGVSAKPMSEISMREQADQVTEGRFEPQTRDHQIGTDRQLLDDYLKKPTAECGVGTAPIIFGAEKPRTHSIMMQTEPMVNEIIPEEPMPATLAYEPETAKANIETGSNSSLQDIPQADDILEMIVIPPPQEPEVEEVYYCEDWYESSLYKYAYYEHYSKLVKKKLITVEKVPKPDLPKEQEGMNPEQRYQQNLNPEGLAILSYMECDYGQAALRHKSAAYCSTEMLQDLYTRAKTTIEVLVANMVRPDICNHILFEHYQDITKKNVIKLLLRVKRLYDARNEAVNILQLVTEVETIIEPKSNLWKIIQDNSRTPLPECNKELLKKAMKILSNCLTHITIFQQEHRLFKDEFKFNEKIYREYIRDLGMIIGGFLKLKHEPNPALQETGLLQEDHKEDQDQSDRYTLWVNASHAQYGKLEVPSEAEIQSMLDKPKKEKGSRIDRALNKMREEQASKADQASNFELTSKSKILQQMQMKSEKLEVIQQHSNQMNEDWMKTGMSDQMIERMQESAQKKQKTAKFNEERLQRHQDGYESPDDNDRAGKSKFAGQNLLMQQMKYDNEMEEQLTTHNRSAINSKHVRVASDEFRAQDSIMSSQTHMQYDQKRQVLVSGKIEDFKSINIGKYDFATSSQDDQHSLGRAYDQPTIDIPVLKMRNYEEPQIQSQAMLNTDRQFSERNRSTQEYNDHASQQVGGNKHHDSVTGSEYTNIRKGAASVHRYNIASPVNHISIQDADDDATEFTEQFDNDSLQHINLETEKAVIAVSHDGDGDRCEGEEDTVFAGDSVNDYGERDVSIINQGQIKIKYQSNTTSHRDLTSPNVASSIGKNSFNDRQ